MNTLIYRAAAILSDVPEEQKKTIWQVLNENKWYILMVIAFGVGLIVISIWSKKIKENDEKVAAELEKRAAEAELEKLAEEEKEVLDEEEKEAAEKAAEEAEPQDEDGDKAPGGEPAENGEGGEGDEGGDAAEEAEAPEQPKEE